MIERIQYEIKMFKRIVCDNKYFFMFVFMLDALAVYGLFKSDSVRKLPYLILLITKNIYPYVFRRIEDKYDE